MSGNTILVNNMLAKYCAAYFRNYNHALRCAYMPFEKDFNMDTNGYNVGQTLQFKLPTYTNVREGIVAQPQDLIERYASITLNNPLGVDWNPNLYELTTNMDSNQMIIERYIKPSVIKLSNKLDSQLCAALNSSVYRVIGTAGATVNSISTVINAKTALAANGVEGKLSFLMNVGDAGTLQSSVSNFFNNTINEDVDINGRLGSLAGVPIYQEQNIGFHTNGTFAAGGNVTIKTTAVSGASTLTLQGFTASSAGVLKAGDIIYVANVYELNPINLTPSQVGTAGLMKFIVSADVNSDGAGEAIVTVGPTMIQSGITNPYNNVNILPQANAIVTLYGGASATYSNNFMFTEDAILLAIKPYFRPMGVAAGTYGSYTDDQWGVTYSVTDWFNGMSFTNLKRLDILSGYTIQPQYAVRVIG